MGSLKDRTKGAFFELEYGKDVKIDSKDKKIISLLGKNCRNSPTDIAKSIYASKDSVRYRINQLIKKDIYRGNIAILNPFILGFPIYILLIKIKSITPKKEEKIAEFFANHPFIVWVGHTQGAYDFHIAFTVKDVTHFDELLKETLSKFLENIKKTETIQITKMYYYNTVPLELQKEANVKIDSDKKNSSFNHILKENTSSIKDEKHALTIKEILVLKEMANNASLSLQEISERTNIKPDTVKNTISSLINKKVILAFRGIFNLSFLKYHGYIIYLRFSPKAKEPDRKEFEEFIKNADFTAFAGECSGSHYDSIVYVFSKNPLEFNRYLNEIRNKFKNIIEDYDTDLILKDYRVTFFPKGILSAVQNLFLKIASKIPK